MSSRGQSKKSPTPLKEEECTKEMPLSSEPNIRRTDTPLPIACQTCRDDHHACDRQFPCGRCVRTGRECIRVEQRPRVFGSSSAAPHRPRPCNKRVRGHRFRLGHPKKRSSGVKKERGRQTRKKEAWSSESSAESSVAMEGETDELEEDQCQDDLPELHELQELQAKIEDEMGTWTGISEDTHTMQIFAPASSPINGSGYGPLPTAAPSMTLGTQYPPHYAGNQIDGMARDRMTALRFSNAQPVVHSKPVDVRPCHYPSSSACSASSRGPCPSACSFSCSANCSQPTLSMAETKLVPSYLQSVDLSVVNIHTNNILRTMPPRRSDTKLSPLEQLDPIPISALPHVTVGPPKGLSWASIVSHAEAHAEHSTTQALCSSDRVHHLKPSHADAQCHEDEERAFLDTLATLCQPASFLPHPQASAPTPPSPAPRGPPVIVPMLSEDCDCAAPEALLPRRPTPSAPHVGDVHHHHHHHHHHIFSPHVLELSRDFCTFLAEYQLDGICGDT